MKAREHYQALFAPLEAAYGPVDQDTMTSVIGFSAGGPVSLRTIERHNIIVTCELSQYPEQKRTTDGLKYEFLSKGWLDLDQARKLFTALGALSMDEVLGDRHTVDVSKIIKSIGPVVRLKLFSKTTIGRGEYGIYQVVDEKIASSLPAERSMKRTGITFTGPEVDDQAFLASLPSALRAVLEESNGFILLHGALHVRGACAEPEWHSLRHAWRGAMAFHELYDTVTPDDIPFAQDCAGDQFLLRNGHVVRLLAETGEVESVAIDLQDFFAKVEEDPEEFLNSAPEHPLQPGQLLHAYPPFCMRSGGPGYSLRPCSAREVIMFHADFAKQIAKVPDGGEIKIKVSPKAPHSSRRAMNKPCGQIRPGKRREK